MAKSLQIWGSQPLVAKFENLRHHLSKRYLLVRDTIMTIRQKILLTIITASGLVAILLSTLTENILLRGFAELESEMQYSGTIRVLNTIEQELATFSATAADWAYWDDTYEYLGGKNPSYIEDNFTAETFANLELNMVLLTDSEGHLIYSEFYEPGIGFIPAPFRLDQATIAGLLPKGSDLEASATGIVEIEGNLLLLASRHILDSHLNPPIRGNLIFGRFLDANKIMALSKTLETNLTISQIDNLAMNEETAILLERSGGKSVLVRQPTLADIASYSLINNLNGEPAFLLQVNGTRDIFNYGLKSIRYFVSTLSLIGTIFLIVMLILIERLVLSRISSLNQSVMAVQEGKDFKVPVEIKGQDEIATFAATFKGKLDELANSHRALEKANSELEARVVQRTIDLEMANETLKKEVYERKQAQAQLQQSRDQALDALRLKEQILANVSHDARTPLSVIILYTQMFQANMYGDFTPKQANALQIILSNAQKMLTFVNNLLAESRAGAKKQEQLQKAHFKTSLLLKDIGTMFQPLAVEKKLQLTSSMSIDVPEEIYGDVERIRQIVNNLVDNAIKFTPAGRIHVALYSEDSESFVIEVSDTGIGIASEDKEKIFDSFWQADGSITRDVNRGVGLGLSIVQKLTTLMGGTISVEANTPNPGTTFKVILPYEKQAVLTA